MNLRNRLAKLESAASTAVCLACQGIRPLTWHTETGENGPDGEAILDPPLPEGTHCRVCGDRRPAGAPMEITAIIIARHSTGQAEGKDG